ncbi:MAG: His/Gly/Thr/Pro-type tRNA ligase C-terminal domain-containing protein, partial [Candidatus Micrarchaeia archaeon]
REFLWQEGHTAHVTKEQADAEVMMILQNYKELIESLLAVPVLIGRKSEGEKFAGALYTTTLEALMPDGKALQAGTSHNLGQNFSKAFGIKFLDENEKEAFAWQTSWGISTRLIGAMIMVHGDDKGVVIPPKAASLEAVIVPIPATDGVENARVLSAAGKLKAELERHGISVKLDDRDDKSPGWKYNEWEMRGVPIRIEIGKRDLEKNGCVMVRRDTGEKAFVADGAVASKAREMLEAMQSALFEKAQAFRDSHVHAAKDYDEFKRVLEKKKGFVRASWCAGGKCEDEIKGETGATVRFVPFEPEALISPVCLKCGEKAREVAYFAKSY